MGRDVKEKNKGMDSTGSADPGKRMAAEERAADERTMGDIIKDATDRYLDSFPEKQITASDLEDMVRRHDSKVRKRTVRAAGIAALFVIVAAGIFFISGGYFDVGADKNPKEQIVKDDMVVSKDGGYGDDGGEDELVITEWDDIENYYKEYLIGLLRPQYIPKGFIFKQLVVQQGNDRYQFNNSNCDLEIHEFLNTENLDSIEITEFDNAINCSKGKIYIQKIPGDMIKATIQFDSGHIIELWGSLTETEIVKIIEHLK